MPSNAASQLDECGGAKTRECNGPANCSHWSASNPTSIMVTMAGTGLARSSTRSIWPDSRWRLDPLNGDGADHGKPARRCHRGEPRQEKAPVRMERRCRRSPTEFPGIGLAEEWRCLRTPGPTERTIEVVFGRERLGVAAAPAHEIVRRDDPVTTVRPACGRPDTTSAVRRASTRDPIRPEDGDGRSRLASATAPSPTEGRGASCPIVR